MEANVQALRARAAGSQPLRRYKEIARLLTGHSHAAAEDGVRWVAALCRTLEVPPLSAYGLDEAAIPALVCKAAVASSMKANPIPLTSEELRHIVCSSL
jgi:alcohol dehydrogenase class IV